jgi:FlaA1/EpsC-like NDP-sugar epimerase
LMLAVGYRVSVRAMHEWREARMENGAVASGRRVLIVGAGDLGELALRDLRSTGAGRACGFLDDDAEKIGLRIHGVPVLAPTKALVEMVATLQVHEVIVAMPRAAVERRDWVVQVCADRHIMIREFQAQASLPAPPLTLLSSSPEPPQIASR